MHFGRAAGRQAGVQGERVSGAVLQPADISYVDQLNLILGVVGTPDDETLKRMSSDKARAYVKTLPVSERVALEDVFPDAEHDGESI